MNSFEASVELGREARRREMRDRIALAVLTAILSNPSRPPQHVDDVANGTKGGMTEAKAAYGWADAMMKAREL